MSLNPQVPDPRSASPKEGATWQERTPIMSSAPDVHNKQPVGGAMVATTDYGSINREKENRTSGRLWEYDQEVEDLAKGRNNELEASTRTIESIRVEGSGGCCSMSRTKKLTVFQFCLSNFCIGTSYSLLSRFFTVSATEYKNTTNSQNALILGCYELVIFIMSPIFGTFLTRIGSKFLFVSGLITCGTASVLFGVLRDCPPGAIFVVMCVLVRVTEGIGAAGVVTSSFAIIGYTFPDNVATMFGSLELFSGLGMMVGPTLGGQLNEAGKSFNFDFELPFVSVGIFIVLIGFASICILPPQADVQRSDRKSPFPLLKKPVVPIMCLFLIIGSGTIGFIDLTLSKHLKYGFNIKESVADYIFLVASGTYAITTPLWGWLSDKKPMFSHAIMMLGFVAAGVGFFFFGPAEFLKLTKRLEILIVSLALIGLGIGTMVITFQVITKAAMACGYPDTLDTFGVVAGITSGAFSLGAFALPQISGQLLDHVFNNKLEDLAAVLGCVLAAASLLLLVHDMIRPCVRCVRSRLNRRGYVETARQHADEERALLRDPAQVS